MSLPHGGVCGTVHVVQSGEHGSDALGPRAETTAKVSLQLLTLKPVKGLSHQGCVLTATARRPRKIQNAMVCAVGSPTAPWALRVIAIGCREDV